MRNESHQSSLAWRLPAVLAAFAIGVPLFVVVSALWSPTTDVTMHLRETVLASYVVNSALLVILTALLAAVFGTSTAWLTGACQFPGSKWFAWLLVLPLAAPAYVVAYAYTDLLDPSGPLQTAFRAYFDLPIETRLLPPIRNLPGAALLLSLVLYPYVYLLARTSFAGRSGAHFDAARVLGHKPTSAFFRVALPGARPAIAAGSALVMMETLADFGVVEYFSVPTFSTGIYRTWIGLGDKTAALKLAAVMLIFVLILLSFERLSRRGSADRTDVSRADPIELRGARALAAIIVCLVPVSLGFVIPVALLATYTLQGGDSILARGYSSYLANSVSVATLTAVIAVVIALLLAYAQRLSPGRPTFIFTRFATLGYALPGVLLAVALLGPVGALDQWLAEHWPGGPRGPVLAGTVFLLIYAYLCRFMTVAFQTVDAGLTGVSREMDAAARTLGASPGRVVLRVHLPLLRPSLLAAALLVFVDVMRELPATLLLRPFNFDTLATRVYRLASDERLVAAAPAALSIVLVGVIPVLLLVRASQRGR